MLTYYLFFTITALFITKTVNVFFFFCIPFGTPDSSNLNIAVRETSSNIVYLHIKPPFYKTTLQTLKGRCHSYK